MVQPDISPSFCRPIIISATLVMFDFCICPLYSRFQHQIGINNDRWILYFIYLLFICQQSSFLQFIYIFDYLFIYICHLFIYFVCLFPLIFQVVFISFYFCGQQQQVLFYLYISQSMYKLNNWVLEWGERWSNASWVGIWTTSNITLTGGKKLF